MKASSSNRFLSVLRHFLSAQAIVITVLSSPAMAATVYWDTNAATAGSGNVDGSWDATTANWSASSAGTSATAAWLPGDTAVFAAGTDFTGTRTVTVSGTQSLVGITLNSQLSNLTITGGTLAFGAAQGAINTSAWGTTSGKTFTLASVITGTNGLTIASNGNLTATGGGNSSVTRLSGVNTFSGDVTITSGLVAYAADSAFGNAANKIVLNGGGLLDNGTNINLARDIQILAGGGTFRGYGTTTTAAWSGAITGTGPINRTDGGTLSLTGNLSGYSGTFTNQGGTTRFQTSTNALTGTLTITGGVASIENSATNTYSAVNLNGGTLGIKNNSNAIGSLTLPVGGSATIAVQSGSSAITLANNITISGTSTLSLDASGGALNLNGNVTGTGVTLQTSGASGTTTLTGTINLGAAGTLSVGGAQTLALSGATVTADTVAMTGTTVANNLNISGGTVTTKYLNIGNASGNSGRVNQSGGTVTVLTGGSGIRIGHWNNAANPGSTYNLSGGTLDASAITANIGWDGQGDIAVGGGAGSAIFKAGTIQLDANGNSVGDMTLTVSSLGTVEVGSGGIGAAAAGDRVILNGGTLKAVSNATWGSVINANSATTSTLDIFGSTITLSNDITGSGIITLANTATGGSVLLNPGAAARTISAGLAGNVDIIKQGAGTLTLSGTSSHNGLFDVNVGTLNLTGSVGSNVTLYDGTTLSGEGTIGGSLNMGQSSGATLTVDPSTAGALNVTGNVTLSGTNTIVFSKPPVANAPNKIFTHGGLVGTVGTDLVVANFADYRSPSLTDSGTEVSFGFVGKSLVWSAASSSDWDVAATSNWSDPADSTFYAGDDVTFDDTGLSGSINLSSTVLPGVVTFNSSSDYTLSGTGSISGTASIVKSGSGSLTLSTSNTYNGATSVNAGILKLGSATALGSTSSGTTIASGATLDVNGRDLSTIPELVTGSGTGSGGGGAIINTSATVGTLNSVALAGDTTFNLANNLVIGVNSTGTSGSFSLGGNTLTKTGSGRLILNGVSVTTGNIVINQGALQLCTTYLSGGGGNQQAVSVTTPGTITINSGGTLATNRYSVGFTVSSPIVLNGGTIQGTGPGPNGATISSNISLAANSTIDFNAGGYAGGLSSVVFSGVISGSGTLTRIGGTNDISSLTGANTYTGGTTLTSGTVAFNNGSLGTTGAITMNGGILRWNTGNTQDVSSRLVMTTGKTASFDTNGNNVTLASALGSSTNANLIKLGAGTLTITGTSTFTGGTAVRAGILSVGSVADTNSNIGSGTASTSYVEVTQGGTLQYTGTTAASISKFLWMDTGASATIDISNAAGSITWTPGGGTRSIPFTKAGPGTLALNGVISGTANVTVSAGTLSLGSSNTYTRGTTLSGGTLNISNDNQLGATYDGSLVSPLTITAGGTGYTTAPAVTISAPNSGATAIATATVASGAVTGVTIGTNGNGYVANPTVTFGTPGTGATATAQVKGLLTFNGGTLNTTAAVTSNRATVLGASGGTINTNGFNSTFSGVFSGAGSLTKVGAGTLNLSGANIATGAFSLSAGTLGLNYATQNNSKLADAGVLTFSGNSTIDLNGGSHTEAVASTTINAGVAATITRSSGTSVLQLGNITRGSQTSTLTLGADGIATTSSLNTNGILGLWATVNGAPAANSTNAANGPIVAFTGYTDVPFGGTIADGATSNVRLLGGTSGNIALGATTTSLQSIYQGLTSLTTIDTAAKTLAFGNGGGIFIPATGGALTLGTAVNSGSITAGTTANSELILSNNSATNALTINSVIANNAGGAVLVTKTGIGSLVLTGTNTYTGATNIVAGTVNIRSAAALGTVAAGTTVTNGAALEIQGGITTLAEPLSITGTGTTPTGGVITNVSGNNTFAGPISLSGASTISVAASTTLTTSGAWTIPSTLTKIGTGTLRLTAYSGSTSTAANDIIINEGALEFGTGYFNANPFPFRTLDITVNNGATLRTTTAHALGGDNIDAGAPMSQIRVNTGGTFQVNGSQYISGGTVSGQGRLVLTGSTVNGTADLRSLPGTVITTLASATTSTISNTNGISLQYGALTLDVADGAATTDLQASGPFTSTNGITKTGAGRLDIAGTNTFSGATTVSAGSLFMNGTVSGTGAVTNASGTTLGGTGGFAGPVTVSGILAPGTTATAIESLATGALTLNSGSTLAAEINTSGSPTADVINVTGSVSLAGALSLADLAVSPVALAGGTKLTLITYTGSLTGTFTGLPEGTNIILGPNTFKIAYNDSGAVTLTAYIADPLLAWATGAPYNLVAGTTALPGADPDNDGIPNIVEFILGGNPASTNDSALLPAIELVTTDVGAGSTDYLKFTFRRSDASAYLNPVAQYDKDLSSPWTTAVNGTNGVVVQTTDDFFAPAPNGIDRVIYYIPRSLAAPGNSLFGRLSVTIP